MPEYNWITEQISTVTEFFTPAECESYIDLAESMGFEDAPINTAFGPQLRKDVRNNSRVILDDIERAAGLFEKIMDYVPASIGDWAICGVNERFRIYRYDVGQQFDWHYDGSFERNKDERSQLTFMVYLNDGFAGGETTLESIGIKPQQGLALFFVHQIRHKGQSVIDGRKYVLRTDVMYRRLNA